MKDKLRMQDRRIYSFRNSMNEDLLKMVYFSQRVSVIVSTGTFSYDIVFLYRCRYVNAYVLGVQACFACSAKVLSLHDVLVLLRRVSAWLASGSKFCFVCVFLLRAVKMCLCEISSYCRTS